MTNRIFITGIAGSGKTTLARKISAALEYEHTPLDKLLHKDSWQKASQEEQLNALADTLSRDEWVIDGIANGIIPEIANKADLVILMDTNALQGLYRVARRFVQNHGKQRPDTGITRRIDKNFFKGVMDLIQDGSALYRGKRINELISSDYDGPIILIDNFEMANTVSTAIIEACESGVHLSEIVLPMDITLIESSADTNGTMLFSRNS